MAKRIFCLSICLVLLLNLATIVKGVTSNSDLFEGCILYLDFEKTGDLSQQKSEVQLNANIKEASIGKTAGFGGSEYIKVIGNDSIQNASEITYELWIAPDKIESDYIGRIFSHSNRNLYISGDELILNQAFDKSGIPMYASWKAKDFRFNPNEYVHIVVSYDNSKTGDKAPTFYINGKQYSSQPVSSFRPTSNMTAIKDTGNEVYIGNAFSLDKGFKGSIGMIRIYNIILTVKQVADLYTADITKYKGVIAEVQKPTTTATPTQAPKPTATSAPTTQTPNPTASSAPTVKKSGDVLLQLNNINAVAVGDFKRLTTSPKKISGEIYVPLYVVAEGLGYPITLSNDNNVATVGNISICANSVEFSLDGYKNTSDSPPLMSDNTLMVSLDFLSKYLNIKPTLYNDFIIFN